MLPLLGLIDDFFLPGIAHSSVGKQSAYLIVSRQSSTWSIVRLLRYPDRLRGCIERDLAARGCLVPATLKIAGYQAICGIDGVVYDRAV